MSEPTFDPTVDYATRRTFGGSGRHVIPGDGIRVTGSPDDVRKVIRRHSAAPLWFHTLDVDPAYVGRHRHGTAVAVIVDRLGDTRWAYPSDRVWTR